MYEREILTQYAKPHHVIERRTTRNYEGQAGRDGVAERHVVSLKLSNANGEKQPHYKSIFSTTRYIGGTSLNTPTEAAKKTRERREYTLRFEDINAY